MSEPDRSIDGVARTLSEVFERKKYSIDYYQREYKWTSKQMAELVTDLTSTFLEQFDAVHERSAVERYRGYFLGSIIVSQKGSQPFIVDGQQRLTSLTLLLTFLHRLQISGPSPLDDDDRVNIAEMILSTRFGKRSFNLDVPDRNSCMEQLFLDGSYAPAADASESVHNLVARYDELDGLFPDELRAAALPFFIEWLTERVQLVQITAYTDDDAYAIFETMNDRGLKLTPADMLKGYLLANVQDGEARTHAGDVWRTRLRALDDRVDDGSSDFLKTWLRSQYATKIRERRSGARPESWDRIGTEFHRWLRGEREAIGLRSPRDFHDFVVRDLDFYSRQYERIVAATSTFEPRGPLRYIRFNADLGFTLQDQLLLAPLVVGDDPHVIDQKLEIVGRFVDILLAWRIWNNRSTDYSTMQYAMFTVMRDIRGLSPEDLAASLLAYLDRIDETFDTRDDLRVHQQNRRRLHRLLARMTDHITVESGMASNYLELTGGSGVRYEVEHIWADHVERHADEFDHERDFALHRDRIGDLLLLPKSFNASYGDEPYSDKRPRYFSHNLLAASLDPQTYEKNPGFLAFIRRSGLPFHPHETFRSADIVERGELYQEIAKQVWNPADLLDVTQRGRRS